MLKLPGRNGHDYTLALDYNSQIWSGNEVQSPNGNKTDFWVTPAWTGPGLSGDTSLHQGWSWNSGVGSAQLLSDWTQVATLNGGTPAYCYTNYRVKWGDGHVVSYPSIETNCQYGLSETHTGGAAPPAYPFYCFSDRSVLTVPDSGAPTLYLEDGSRPLTFEDSNGNWITTVDTLGRSIPSLPSSSQSSSFNVTYADSNGNPQTIQFIYQNWTINPNLPSFGNGYYAGYAQTVPTTWSMLTTVIAANGDRWDFRYDPDSSGYSYGELTKVTYPSGGYTQYQYATVGSARGGGGVTYPKRQIVQKQVCRDTNTRANGGSCASNLLDPPTTLAPTSDGTQNTVVDAVGNETVFTISAAYPYGLESERQIYQGSGQHAVLLRTIDTANSCDGPTSQTITLNDTPGNNPWVSKTVWNRGTPITQYSGGLSQSANVTQKVEYAFGQGSPGSAIRTTNYTWLATNSVNGVDYTALPVRITNRKTSETVLDGNNNTVAQTTYEYDNYGSIGTSGAIQHDSNFNTGYTTRGNVTKISHWLNTNNSWLNTTNTYDDAGNILTTTDPNGNVTSFSYTDNFTDGVNHNTAAYVTQTTLPATNGVAHVSRKQYYYNTGLVSASCGENSTLGTCAYGAGLPQPDYADYTYDAVGRPLSTTVGDGGQTTISYSDDQTNPPPQFSTTTTQNINSSLNKTSTALMDGIGEVIQTQLTSDPQGTDYVDTTYDAVGRTATVSNPHRSGSSSTDGTTSYSYDALNRTLSVHEPDGSTVGTSYAGNQVTVTDEAGNPRRSTSDALGRLIEVDEPGQQGGAPGTGSVTVSGTEQVIGGTAATGSVTVNGSEQIVPATTATGSVTISGSERWTSYQYQCGQYSWCTQNVPDGGEVVITVNGRSDSYGYGPNDTSATVASGLASAINNDGSAAVTASASGSTVYLTAKVTGSAGDYSLSTSSYTTNNYFTSGTTSFPATASGSSLTGGNNAIYDSGTASIIVNGFTASYNYGSSDNTTTIASGLASALGAGGSPVNASASGSTVYMTSKTAGTAGDYSLSTSVSWNSSVFSSASFSESRSGSSLTGGTNGVSDSGTLKIIVNGFTASYNYGAADTPSTIAAGLASGLNNSSSPVTASASGSTINLTATTEGANTNYSLSTSDSWNTGSFSNPSFTESTSGANLTGGVNYTYSLNTPWVTLYTYDTLNNLINVTQKGSAPSDSTQWRVRTFTYDSLSRLVCGANPEIQNVTCPTSATGSFPAGAVTYTYDSDGNALTKTTPAQNQGSASTTETVSYSYDALNRLTQKSFTAISPLATPTNHYGYDGVAPSGCATTPPGLSDSYPKGRRTSMCDSSGATSWSHEVMGRIAVEKRTINPQNGGANVTETVSYAYNYDGSVKTLTYPSGRVITYAYTQAGRAQSAVDSADGINYATNALYTPAGALTSMTNGAAISVANSYNSRQQPITLSAGTSAATIMSLSYNFAFGSVSTCSGQPSSGDNGNVVQVVNNRDNNRTQNFCYDGLNRIQAAYSSGPNWGEQFQIDAWGNMTEKASYPGKTNWEGNAGSAANVQNRLSGYTYDAMGNMSSNGAYYYYDAENHMITASAGYSYVYDGDGNRVEKCPTGSAAGTCASGATNGTLYWMDDGGNNIAESDLAGNMQEEYVFFGRRIARRDASSGNVHYYFADFLGSSSLVTDANGDMPPQEEEDFYPYGGEMVITGGDSNHYKFTGKERDSESGLDDFVARYYSSTLGRFVIPDWSAGEVPVPYASLGSPQTLNLYAYVMNNPVSKTDPNGHACEQTGCDDSHGQGSSLASDFSASMRQAWETSMEAEVLDAAAAALAAQNQVDATVEDSPADQTTSWNPCVQVNRATQGATAVAASTTAAPTTMEEVDAAVKPLVDSAVSATEKAGTGFLRGLLGVVGFVFLSSKEAGTPQELIFEHEQKEKAEEAKPATGAGGAGKGIIPGHPFRGPNAAHDAFKHLQQFHGIDPHVASDRLHQIKQRAGLGGADNAVIGRTGDVYNPYTGEKIGSLTSSH